MARKKRLVLLLTAITGVVAARKAKARKDEQALWAEATSTPPTAP